MPLPTLQALEQTIVQRSQQSSSNGMSCLWLAAELVSPHVAWQVVGHVRCAGKAAWHLMVFMLAADAVSALGLSAAVAGTGSKPSWTAKLLADPTLLCSKVSMRSDTCMHRCCGAMRTLYLFSGSHKACTGTAASSMLPWAAACRGCSGPWNPCGDSCDWHIGLACPAGYHDSARSYSLYLAGASANAALTTCLAGA